MEAVQLSVVMEAVLNDFNIKPVDLKIDAEENKKARMALALALNWEGRSPRDIGAIVNTDVVELRELMTDAANEIVDNNEFAQYLKDLKRKVYGG